MQNDRELIKTIEDAAPADNSQSSQKDLPPNAESEVQQDMVIAEDDLPLVLDFITESAEHIESAEAGLLELESKPDDTEVLNQIFRAFHTIKGLAGFLNITDIGSLAHWTENLLDLARKGQLLLDTENSELVFKSLDVMKKMLSGLKKSAETSEPRTEQPDFRQLMARFKDRVSGQVSIDSHSVKTEGSPEKKMPSGPDRRGGIDRRASVAEKIKVSTVRLDNLVNMVGELVTAQLMIGDEHELNRKVTHQGKIVRELQELSMSMRMVTIQGVFQKMARLVRDLSHQTGKSIDFSAMGEETELDRNIVDRIVDPLVHMVRNSVDHGIESPEERKKTGKNPNGRIELRAFHQAGNIIIEIEDDGGGLNKERILQKAIESGLVKTGQELSDQEIFDLIFHAGFSTAQTVTSVSGRGVGMDVVKKNIESLRGKINTSSTSGKGTIFTIRLPLTLAIIDGLVVKVGDERYIIPIGSILGVIRPTFKEFATVQNRGEMIKIRGQLVHMVRLYKLLGVVPKTEDITESLLVLVEEGNKKCCLLIDELLGHQQVVIKSLDKGLCKVKGVSGGAIMGNGKVSLILDIPGLIELAER
jgi:two-component system chemotaxis sensor kinase CheA